MSNTKSETSESMPVIRVQSSSTSLIKSEFVAPPQPHPAAFTCEYCHKEFSMKQYLIRHVVEIHGDTCKPVKHEPYSARSVTSESLSYSIREESDRSAIDTDRIIQSGSGTSDRQRLTFTDPT
eukprot:655702_1